MSYQSYHSFYLDLIKKIVKASFVGWVEVKGEKFLRVIINKDEKLLPFPAKKEITEETYTDLIEKLTKQNEQKE